MSAKYKVQKKQLIDIVEAYRQRSYVEEMDIIKKLGGTQGLLNALNVNPDVGISATSLDERTAVFGSHHKDPPTGDTFCSMVLGVLDDFMLKLLLVCATFSIIVDMSFAATDPDPDKIKTAWIEGFAIYMAVAIVSLVSAWSDYQKQAQFLAQQQLEELSKNVSYNFPITSQLFSTKSCAMEQRKSSTATTSSAVTLSRLLEA